MPCVAEHRVEVVDHPGVDRLPLAGRLGHRVDGQAVVDPGGVVALEQVVGQRAQQEVVVVAGTPSAGSGSCSWSATSHLSTPPISSSASSLGRCRADELVERLVQRGPEPGRGGQPVLQELPGPGLVEGLGEQVGEVVHDDALVPASCSTNASCSSRARCAHMTSSKSSSSTLPGVSRVSSSTGPVHDDLLELADLGVDVEGHDGSPFRLGRPRDSRSAHRYSGTASGAVMDPRIDK